MGTFTYRVFENDKPKKLKLIMKKNSFSYFLTLSDERDSEGYCNDRIVEVLPANILGNMLSQLHVVFLVLNCHWT